MGIVTSLIPKVKPEASKLKFLITLAREEPDLTPDLVSLARWLADYYAAKRDAFPPECERDPDAPLTPDAARFNLGNPIR